MNTHQQPNSELNRTLDVGAFIVKESDLIKDEDTIDSGTFSIFFESSSKEWEKEFDTQFSDSRYAQARAVELKSFISQLLEAEKKRCREIVSEEHYKLEEWFVHNDATPKNYHEAHQQSMRTRSAVLQKLS